MPSHRLVILIVAFWLAVTGYVAYRDVWPVLFASGPPAVAIDLADEAAQNVPIHWQARWNGNPVGKLTTQMRYVEADDTFRFTTTYIQLRIEISGVTVGVQEFTSTVRVTRDGDLREQSAEGKLVLEFRGVRLGDVTGKLAGTVNDGRLAAKFEGSYGFTGGTRQHVTRTLDPVPVPKGQPLNPLQPVNRLRGVSPGRSWVVNEVNPLNDAVVSVAREMGLPLPNEKTQPLVGEVLPDPQNLDWRDEQVSCWVIEYRRDGELQVRTWVRTTDGKVLKQEASAKGESLSVVREE